MTEQKFRCGDVVKGMPAFARREELGVVKSSVRVKKSKGVYEYKYSINWELSGEQSWFDECELELKYSCPIRVGLDRKGASYAHFQ